MPQTASCKQTCTQAEICKTCNADMSAAAVLQSATETEPLQGFTTGMCFSSCRSAVKSLPQNSLFGVYTLHLQCIAAASTWHNALVISFEPAPTSDSAVCLQLHLLHPLLPQMSVHQASPMPYTQNNTQSHDVLTCHLIWMPSSADLALRSPLQVSLPFVATTFLFAVFCSSAPQPCCRPLC